MTVNREIKTGIFAIIILALFVWGYNFIKNQGFYDNTRTFYAEYTNVQGLSPKSPITINGLKVGTVSEITFHPQKKGILVAHLNLSNDIQFSKNSVAQIYSPDFISGKSLKINISIDEGEMAKDGDTLIGEVDSGIMGMINEQIAPLQSKVESFVVHTDSVMQNINEIMNEENQKNIKESLANMNAVLGRFKNTARNLDVMTSEGGKIDSIITGANKAMGNFVEISDSIKAVNIGTTIAELQHSLESFNVILDSVKTGNGSIGKLMQDEELYNNLTNASKELEELLREVKEHPKRFVHLSVFGRKEKPYEPPVEE
ncbi:MlaD family protein [Lutimonas saemankumensis]|uniref:MlaD family protein n=1 Tax=Lutimonas saemankumensis TaxID=483016 RepID=UPI001CD5E068|nr:MlaD family protein [Lutimonas saemankumensis]MCA0931243.1 MlaD family protein [Lutimonas saemankumensis]